MSNYRVLFSTFWTGDTGRHLRKNPDAQRLALYLITCPSANMIGLYYLPTAVICHELGIDSEGASKALRWVSEGGFAFRDDASETVFVPEMARFQVGDNLKKNDRRRQAVINLLNSHKKSRFFQEFLDRYRDAFHLEELSPIEGASKGHRRGNAQEQEQEQEQDQRKEDCSEPVYSPPSEPLVMNFKTTGKVSGWNLTKGAFESLRAAYPGVDILAECRKAGLWMDANPAKRKTAGGMLRFLQGWMDRAQNGACRSNRSSGNGNGVIREAFIAPIRQAPELGVQHVA